MKVAVVGATGLVGTKMLDVLAERNFPVTELIPVASEKSVGKEVLFKGNQKLSRVPRPYSAGHPAAAYLKLKSFAALRNVTDAELTAPSFPKLLHTTMAALEPLLHFLNAPLME